MKTSSRVVTETPKLVIPYSSSLSILQKVFMYFISIPTQLHARKGIERQLKLCNAKELLDPSVLIHITILHYRKSTCLNIIKETTKDQFIHWLWVALLFWPISLLKSNTDSNTLEHLPLLWGGGRGRGRGGDGWKGEYCFCSCSFMYLMHSTQLRNLQ